MSGVQYYVGKVTSLLAFGLLLQSLLVPADSMYNLVLSPPHLTVEEGGTAVMACSPFIIPESLALILVQQDSYLLSMSTEPRLLQQDFVVVNFPFQSNRTYTLSRVQRKDDQTRFRCILGDLESNEVTLRVYVPPELSGPSGRVYVMEGSSVTKNFHYEELVGLPPANSFTWQLNGRPFHGNTRINLQDGNRTLSVRLASRTDAGVYMLTVNSGSGGDSLQLDLEITYDEFIQTPKNCIVEAGESITLNCRHRFGRTHVWTTNRVSLNTLGSKVTISADNTTLHYGPVDYRDHLLTFTCTAHSLDEENVFVSSAILSVKAPPQVTGPAEISAIENRDSEVTLSFQIHSFPPPNSMTYMHNGRSIDFSRRITNFTNGSIRILNPIKEDAGEYILNVANTLGSDSVAIVLIIFCAPEIVGLSGPWVAQYNKTARIPCGAEVRGHPPPTYQWQHLPTPGVMIRDLSGQLSESGELVLRAVRYEDSGVYQCSATNSVGYARVSISLLVLDPPGPPLHPIAILTDRTWSIITWSAPAHGGDIGTISKYAVTAIPRAQPSNYSEVSFADMALQDGGSEGVSGILRNSSCIEFECETRYEEVPGNLLSVNLTRLVPGVGYSLVVVAFSNGSNLQSKASRQITINTQAHVPGIGSVASFTHGPGSANISWTLAFSGGHPVTQFHIECKLNNSFTWRRVLSSTEVEEQDMNTTISPDNRFHVVHQLEAEEHYVFRVAGSNILGRGDFTETSETLLSHHIGVPSPPTRPEILSWKGNCVTISTTISKFGSESNFSLGYVLMLNGTRVSAVTGMDLPEGYKLNESVELSLSNVSYRGDWMFSVFATNYLGSSLLSEPSLAARENIQQQTPSIRIVGTAMWSVMGMANIVVMAMSMIMCRVMSWETKKQKKSLARRLEIVRDQSDSCPFSPRSILTFGDYRSSPDGRSTNVTSTHSNYCSHVTAENLNTQTNHFPLNSV